MNLPKNDATDFYIVDFDRTLVDTDKLLEIFMEIASTYYEIPREQIKKADADVKATGDSFDTAGYVRDHLFDKGRNDDWDDLQKRFIHESRSLNYLLPGAAEFLEWLDAHGERYGILTYGHPLWQKLKMTAAGFNHVHHIVMEQKEKGKFIRSWQDAEGGFNIPDEFGKGLADRVVLIDDKAISFADFPDTSAIGYWVVDQDHLLPSQEGVVPENVVRVGDLQTLISQYIG